MLKMILPALLLIAGSALAQSISGVVEDPKGAVIPGAKVSFAGKTATSGNDGRYTLDQVSGSGAITVTAEGFQQATKNLNAVTGSVTEDFRLELDIASDSITVTSKGTAISLEEAGVSASVFTEEDLKVRNFNRVADVLRDVPGLNLVQTGSNGGITSIFGRGGDSNAMLVMIDGIPITDPGGALNVAGLSTPGLDRVEVVRGPQSSLYGAEAASGVIQLQTKRGDPEAIVPHGEIAYERGSFSTDHSTMPLRRINIVLPGNTQTTYSETPRVPEVWASRSLTKPTSADCFASSTHTRELQAPPPFRPTTAMQIRKTAIRSSV